MNAAFLRKKVNDVTTWLRSSSGKYIPILIYLLVTGLILGPFFAPGFVLHYDMLFAPHINLSVESAQAGVNLYHNLAVTAVLKLISFIFPVDFIQKMLLIAIFFAGMYGMYRVLPVPSLAARLLAGFMYMVNPFVYDRLMAGHWRFLLAYSITPLVVMAFFKLYTSPSRKYLLFAIVLWTVAVLVSAHHLVILGLLFIILGALFVRSWKPLLRATAALLVVLVLNLWWILPIGSSPNFTESFGIDHFYAFATTTDPMHGLWFNMLSLQGFWHDGWQSVKDFFVFWPAIVVVWLVPVSIGIAGWRAYKSTHKKLLLGLVIAAFIGFLLAAGPYPAVWQLNNWVFTHVPGMAGMRESQKFLALLALTYAFFAAFGVNFLMKRYKKLAFTMLVTGVVATVLLAWPIFWGAQGQLRLSHYPDSWHKFYETLQMDKTQAKVLILPWSVYTPDTFVGANVANPARVFFGNKAVVSERMNLPGVTDWTPPANRQLEIALETKNASLLAKAMQQQNIRYVAVTTPVHQEDYEWLLSGQAFSMTIFDEKLIIVLLTSR